MTVRAGGLKALWVAAVLVAGCAGPVQTPIPSGQGSVVGWALGTDFSYAPNQLTATFETLPDGRIDLSVRLCQADCEPLGLVISPASRAVMVSITAAPAEFQAPVVFQVNQPARQALAAYRDDANRLTDRQSTTRVTNAISGTVTFTQVDLRAGGSVTGRFNLQLDDTGSVVGEFFAPVLVAGAAANTATQ